MRLASECFLRCEFIGPRGLSGRLISLRRLPLADGRRRMLARLEEQSTIDGKLFVSSPKLSPFFEPRHSNGNR